MEQYVVYCYTSPNGKKYIGITNNEKRENGNINIMLKMVMGIHFIRLLENMVGIILNMKYYATFHLEKQLVLWKKL